MTSLSGGTPAEHYVVRRYTAGGSLQTVLPSCSGDITATSCVEQIMPTGTWRYSVQAAIGGWLGPESALGSAVTVGDAALTLSPTTVTSLPATLNGTITNFANGEGLSFHLDSATGTALSGTPTVVPASGTAPVTVTLPVGTPDSPHSIFAVGSTGTAASAAITINDPPDLASLVMRDVNTNGKVDQVLATFDDTLAPYSAGIAPWTLTNTPSGGSLTDVSVTGNVATLTIAEGPSAATTAVGTFKVALAANSAGIRDSDEHLTSFAATAPVDQAPPAVISAVMQDTGTANGRIDRVVLTFSEAMATYSAGTAPWSLANVPSGGTLASVATTSTTATLTITEGAGAPDTSVGSFTVTMTSNATGVRDAAGNLASFSGAPSDGAKPVRVLGEMFDGDADGRVDQVVVTFSEVLASYSAGTGVWTLTSAPSGATLNNVTVAGTQATLALDEGTGTATTAVGSFRTALAASATGIRDGAGNQSSYNTAAPADKAAPVLLTLSMLDNNSNGIVDRVTAVFSETLTGYTAGTSPWTLTNVPSGGTLASVTTATATATLIITEGAGALDTSVGAMTVALATDAAGVHDAALNLASFSATTPLDKAKPAAVTIVDTNGATDGRIEVGDTLSITFSEALDPATVPATTTVTLTDPVGTGNDTLAIAGIINGAPGADQVAVAVGAVDAAPPAGSTCPA